MTHGREGALERTWSMCASSMLPFFSNTTSKSVSGSCKDSRGEESSLAPAVLKNPRSQHHSNPSPRERQTPLLFHSAPYKTMALPYPTGEETKVQRGEVSPVAQGRDAANPGLLTQARCMTFPATCVT